MNYTGTSNDDTLTGTASADHFVLTQGGHDTATGAGGADIFTMGGALDDADKIDGGAGNDTVVLDGDYTNTIAFAPTTMVNVERILLKAGNDYKLTFDDATIASGQTLKVDGSSLGAADSLSINGYADINGILSVQGGAAADILLANRYHTAFDGGDGGDILHIYGGYVKFFGGAGDDNVTALAEFNVNSVIDGGTGSNQIFFNGDFSKTFILKANLLHNIVDTALTNGFDYSFTVNDATLASGQSFAMYGQSLDAGHTFFFNGASETDGDITLQGGAGKDRFTGGGGDDSLQGGGNADIIAGGGGNDIFRFLGVSDSTGAAHDRITDFDAGRDTFSMGVQVLAVDTAVTTGTLGAGNFDSNLAGAIGSGQLGAHHAVLFTPDAGNLHGHTFMVVDANGVAGYQAGADYVVEVTGITGTLTTADFG